MGQWHPYGGIYIDFHDRLQYKCSSKKTPTRAPFAIAVNCTFVSTFNNFTFSFYSDRFFFIRFIIYHLALESKVIKVCIITCCPLLALVLKKKPDRSKWNRNKNFLIKSNHNQANIIKPNTFYLIVFWLQLNKLCA